MIREKYKKYTKLPNSQIEKSIPAKRYIAQKQLEDNHTFDRLPLVAFPGYTLAIYDAAEFATTAPLQNIAIFLGISSKSVESVSLSVKEVETYGLDAYQALSLFFAYCKRELQPSEKEYSYYSTSAPPCHKETIEIARSRLSDGPTSQTMEPMMISRVYMTRSIQYTFRGDNVFGLSAVAGVTLNQAVTNQQKLQGLLNNATIQKKDRKTDVGDANPTYGEDVINQAHQALNELGASLNALAKSQVPQSRFSFVSADSRGITLEETFERPLVIGYEGLFLYPLTQGDKRGHGQPTTQESPPAGEDSEVETSTESVRGTIGPAQVLSSSGQTNRDDMRIKKKEDQDQSSNRGKPEKNEECQFLDLKCNSEKFNETREEGNGGAIGPLESPNLKEKLQEC